MVLHIYELSVMYELPKILIGFQFKMGSGRPRPDLGPGLVASRPISSAMGRPILRKLFSLVGPMGTPGPTQNGDAI
jgi:hypothetical protein